MSEYSFRYRGHEHMVQMAEAHRRACDAAKLTYCITCPKCGKQFEIRCTENSYNKGRYKKYCSRSCANSHIVTNEHKAKTSATMLKRYEMTRLSHHCINKRPYYEKVCIVCGKVFHTSRKQAECCSRQCVTLKPGYRENLRMKVLERVANGTHNGWNSRNISSYAENFWCDVLDNNNITYVREYHLGKYFLDFYIEINGRKIDLEIDGQQHKRQVEHDYIRDVFMKSQGIEVYRIKWNGINSDAGKIQMRSKINTFLEYIKK